MYLCHALNIGLFISEMKLIKEGELVPAQDFKNRKSNKYFIGKSLMGGMIQDDHIPFLNKSKSMFFYFVSAGS